MGLPNPLLAIYERGLRILFVCARAASVFIMPSSKARRFLELRGDVHLDATLERLADLPALPEGGAGRIWFHVASAGELEQAVPVARDLHARHGVRFVVSYFSPSTEPFLENFPALDASFGLPLDARTSHAALLAALKARGPLRHLAFVRYDLWPGLLRAAKDGGVRVSLLAATTRGTRGGIFGALSGLRRRFVHGELDAVFTVDSIDVAPLAASAPRAVVVHAGDPKWARAKERAEALRTRGLSTRLGALSSLCREFQARGGKVFVFGSPHAEEHGVALRCASLEGALVVYVPHDVAPASLAQLEAEITAQGLQPARCHGLTRIEAPLPDIIVVDVMGLLAEIYSLADAAIVGGGFDGQVHNTLEPAAHPVAVLMGSSLTRAPEAQQLVASGAAQAFDSPEAMFQFLSACVRIGVASDEGVSPRPAQRQLVELRRRSLELFKCVPATSEVVSKTLFS